MGISASGFTKFTSGNIAKILITFAVFLVFFVFLYGPPLVPALRDSALARCNAAQGGDYRSYQLQWKTIFFGDLTLPPHWQCTNIGDHPHTVSLGWYAGVTF